MSTDIQTNVSPKPVPVFAARSAPVNPELLKNLDSELLAISTAKFSEQQVRERFRRLSIAVIKAIGCCHVRRDDDGDWDVKPSHSDGRVPRRQDFVTALNPVCELAINSNKIQIHKPAIPKTNGLFVPVNVTGVYSEVFLLVVPEDHDLGQSLMVIERVVASFRLWLSGREAHFADWKLNSLAMIMELCGKVETCPTVDVACEELVNEMQRALGCGSVAFARKAKTKLRLNAVSGGKKVDRSSEIGRSYLETHFESQTRECPGLFPANLDENSHLLIAHQRLTQVLNCEAVYSQPLETDNGDFVGSMVLTGTSETLGDKRTARFLAAAAPKIASSLHLLKRSEKSWLTRTLNKIWKLTTVKARYIALASLAFFAAAMFVPMQHRVRCNGTVEPADKRFAVAPFSGLIVSGFVKPGDRVKKDEVLAEMDGKTVRWELSGILAEKKQAIRKREIELAGENVPNALMAELESRRLISREKVLRFKEDNLQIKSPVDGVVLSGSLENAEAASVETGKVLFEVGTIDPAKFQIAIPATEFGAIACDAEVKIWIEGNESQPITAKLERIYPRSEMKDAKNVFLAELDIQNEDQRFMPGMKGVVRIECGKKRLGWILFHKPANYFRANWAWW